MALTSTYEFTTSKPSRGGRSSQTTRVEWLRVQVPLLRYHSIGGTRQHWTMSEQAIGKYNRESA